MEKGDGERRGEMERGIEYLDMRYAYNKYLQLQSGRGRFEK
jgi:hypothetical protein